MEEKLTSTLCIINKGSKVTLRRGGRWYFATVICCNADGTVNVLHNSDAAFWGASAILLSDVLPGHVENPEEELLLRAYRGAHTLTWEAIKRAQKDDTFRDDCTKTRAANMTAARAELRSVWGPLQ